MEQDIKKPEKEWTMLHFFLGLIFWKKYASSSPIIRGLGPVPELKRPINPMKDKTDQPNEE